MSFDEKIAALIQRIPKVVDHLQTEEATKNALIMPFIAALGYDVFNPQEVIPEFTADVGTKKGEKVDYAVMHNGEVIFLIECKKAGVDLSQAEMSQLFRYFAVTKARIGILTNGIRYHFFSDLEEPNKMDTKPFLELNLVDAQLPALEELRRYAKEDFNLGEILSTANELKHNSAIKKIFAIQFDSPDDEFVKFFFTRTNAGSKFTATAKEQFTPVVTKALQQFINERISDRLRSALQSETKLTIEEEKVYSEEPSSEIITTEEELEGFRIVRAIVAKVISPDRVVHRDTKTYMGILLDDNNRKPVCRLWFNSKQKYVGLLENKNEVKIAIESLTDIYKYSDRLVATVQSYETQK